MADVFIPTGPVQAGDANACRHANPMRPRGALTLWCPY